MRNRVTRFRAFYNGTMYYNVLVGSTLVPQVMNDRHDLVNLCMGNEEYYVMEYANREDRYGKRIYEGDILYRHHTDRFGNKAGGDYRVVEFNEEENCWNIKNGLVYEIVGNVHEDIKFAEKYKL